LDTIHQRYRQTGQLPGSIELTAQIPHLQTSRNFVRDVCLTGAVAGSCDNITIRYVFPVLWMTSCLHILGR